MPKDMTKFRHKRKDTLVKALGGKCVVCSYNKCLRSLDFHHIDGNKKEFGLSNPNNQSVEKIIEEAKKCVVLCKNCHGEYHDGLIELPKELPVLNEEMVRKELIIPKKIIDKTACLVCGKEKPSNQKFCSQKCSQVSQYRVDWNAINLKKLLDQGYNINEISKIINVSYNGVKKRIKALNLIPL